MLGGTIANKAVAEKKIIAIGKRNDGVHEINAGGAPPLPVDWNRRLGQPQAHLRFVAICLRQKAAPDAILDEPSTLHPF